MARTKKEKQLRMFNSETIKELSLRASLVLRPLRAVEEATAETQIQVLIDEINRANKAMKELRSCINDFNFDTE